MKTFRFMYIQYLTKIGNAGTGDYSSVTEELPKTDLSEKCFEKYLPWNQNIKRELEELAKQLREN